MTRNYDIQPTDDYERIQNGAANRVVAEIGYGGSAEALALKQAFVLGSNTAPYAMEGILEALRAGRKWANEGA